MPDNYAIRMYEGEKDRHRKNAIRALREARQAIDRVLASPGTGYFVGGDTRLAAQRAAEGWVYAQQYLAANDCGFLLEEPGAPK